MINTTIVKIQRIQNKKLWKVFQIEADFVAAKHNKAKLDDDSEIMSLFHGTRNTKPSQIYDGEEGFDIKFSSGGMWG